NTQEDRRSAAIADYVLDSGNAGVYRNPRNLPTYGFGNAAPVGQSEKEIAARSREQGAPRPAAGGTGIAPIQDPGAYKVDPDLLNAGAWEKFGGIAGSVLSGVGGLMNASQQRTYLEALMKQNVPLNPEEQTLAKKLGMKIYTARPANIEGNL